MPKTKVQQITAQVIKEGSDTPSAPKGEISEKRIRTKDRADFNDHELWEKVSTYLNNSNKLRDNYSEKLYWLIVGEVLGVFLCLLLYGFGKIVVPQWMFALIISGVLAETFYTIHLITENLFPKKDVMEHLASIIEKLKK